MAFSIRKPKSWMLASRETKPHTPAGKPRGTFSREGRHRLLVTVGGVLAAAGLRWWLGPVLGDDLPFMGFIAVTLFASWYGGTSMGLLALILGFLIGIFFMTAATEDWNFPKYPLDYWIRFLRYLLTGLLGVIVIGTLRREVDRRRRSEEELRAAQEQLRVYAEDLERLAAERTVKLQESLDTLQGVLYHVAHDLRAPLRAMQGFSTLLGNELIPRTEAQAQDYCRRIAEAASRMDMLLKDLLEYGRLGHAEVALTRADLNTAVGNVLRQMAHEMDGAGAQVVVAPDMPEVQANTALLEEVITNLLENALKFTAPGIPPRIRIWAEQRASMVRVWVEDNGIGIDPRFRDRIFGLFEQLHPPDQYPGTGVGLAVVAKGMQRMRGAVGVESQPGAGSRFWLDFQALEVAASGHRADGDPPRTYC